MREQYCASGGKTVKLGEANMLLVGLTRLSALPRVRGQWTDAGRPAHSLSVDWQAWGTKGGLCWRATRDGLRHVPAGPPKSPYAEDASVIASDDTRQPPVNRRYSARTAMVSVQVGSRGLASNGTREIAPINRNSVFCCVPSAGAGKKRAFLLARTFRARGFGVAVGVGVRATDSHAPSNTWESVHKFGLTGNGVVI
jgi:hypothetical protein